MSALSTASSRRTNWPLIVALSVIAVYAVFRTARSVAMLYPAAGWDGHDLRLIYESWQQFISREHAPKAFEKITYLPYVWWCLTPLFCLKWPVVKALSCVGNFVLAIWVCRHVSRVLALNRIQAVACAVFFFSWLGTGLVIGLENLVMLCLACALGAGRLENIPRQISMVPAAFKHSISFPIFLHGVLRRPLRMVLPCSILAALTIAALLWAHVSTEQIVSGLKAAQSESQQWMQEYRTSCLLPIFQSVVGRSLAAQGITWFVWILLFGWFVMKVKDCHVMLAGLLLLSLLPLYHRNYDMIVALPALGILLKYRHWLWSVALSLALCGLYDSIDRNFFQHFAALSFLSNFYYPTVVIALLTLLMAIDQEIGSAGSSTEATTSSRPSGQQEQAGNLIADTTRASGS